MPSYILYSLIAAFGFAVSSILNKFASKHAITDKWTLLFWYYFTFIPFALLIPLLTKIVFPQTLGLWIFLVVYSLLFLLGNICFFIAVFKLDVSVISPFSQLQAAFLAILAFLFLGERFSVANYLWIVIILIGAIFVSFEERLSLKTFFQKSILLIIGMQFFHASANLMAGFILQSLNFWNLMWWTVVINTVPVLLFTFFVNRLRVKVSWKQLNPMFLVNFAAFIAAASLFRAFQENLTISGTISLLTAPITFIITVIFSKINPQLLEHHTKQVYILRGAGIILILFGAVMLSIK